MSNLIEDFYGPHKEKLAQGGIEPVPKIRDAPGQAFPNAKFPEGMFFLLPVSSLSGPDHSLP